MSIFYVLPNKDYYAADDECQELDKCILDGVIPALTDILATDKKRLVTIKSLYFKSY